VLVGVFSGQIRGGEGGSPVDPLLAAACVANLDPILEGVGSLRRVEAPMEWKVPRLSSAATWKVPRKRLTDSLVPVGVVCEVLSMVFMPPKRW